MPTAGKIHMSHETATLLRQSGRLSWVIARDDFIEAKGKGHLRTFWLDVATVGKDGLSIDNSMSGYSFDSRRSVDDRIASHTRLIEWNTGQLLQLLKKIVAYRQYQQQGQQEKGQAKKTSTAPAVGSKPSSKRRLTKSKCNRSNRKNSTGSDTHSTATNSSNGGNSSSGSDSTDNAEALFHLDKDSTYLDEVAQIIHLPKSRVDLDVETMDVNDIVIDDKVVQELRLLMQNIAAL